jgi:hypothetical protein
MPFQNLGKSLTNKASVSQAWWYMLVIPALWSQRLDDCYKFDSLIYSFSQ